ncbi:FixH family protein [Lentibacillus sp. N15]|uniref:FixH family protein n=1 Tax=Lentibacillus songyuanensis TaxID=3136161 RepID=UPI0031BBAEBC
MKRITVGFILLLFVTGCGSNGFTLSVDNQPYMKEGEQTTEIILRAEDDNGEPVKGLTITGEMEMEKMDHGTIAISFSDNGDGTYVGEVELPMGGEWIMATNADKDGKKHDDQIRFEVSEG